MTHTAQTRYRIDRALDRIHADRGDPIDLDALASEACLSKYHFARVFTSRTGETPMRFLWRVRLERAARRLAFDAEARITDIALDCGFASSQSLAHVFQGRFGISPQAHRRAPVWRRSEIPFSRPARAPTASVRIVDRRAMRVAYIRRFGPYWRQSGAIPEAFRALHRWADIRGLTVLETPRIGLCPDNRLVTPDARCQYDACLPVPDWIVPDDIVGVQTIPAGRYAVLSASCANDEILYLWHWLAGVWRAERRAPFDPRWSFEVFQHMTPVDRGGMPRPEAGIDLYLRIGDGPESQFH